MRARSYDSNETFDAETRADDLNAHKLTRLSLEHGRCQQCDGTQSRLCFHRSIVSKCFFQLAECAALQFRESDKN